MTGPENPPGGIPVQPGEILAGKYRVDRVLGVGGMGVVVAATHLQLQQRVALKFMLDAGLVQPTLVERFGREARAAVRLRSDHVARVLDVGTLDTGSPYIVMEYLDGSDIGSVLEQRGAMPVEMAVDCVLQACDAVAEAHALGIVHRDLKPRNLFLTARNDGRGLVKVLDFGISKQTTGSDLSLTRTTEIMGSPSYMSPEQFRSAKLVDERSDIWALGAILYELLSGQVPFVADSVTALTAMVLMDAPRPLASLRANVPTPLVRAIERCLEKDPRARFQSVAELALALEPFAPADTRELAARIARIGAGATGALATSPSRDNPRAVSGTSGNWSQATVLQPATRRIRVAIVGLSCAAAAGALVFVLTRKAPPAAVAVDPSPLPVAPSATAAPVVLTPEAPPVVTARAEVNVAPSAAPPAAAHGPAMQVAAPRPVRAKADAQAPTGSEDAPKYRTTW
jgi:serine/threonine protein kinase